MANRSQPQNPNPENDPNDAPEMKDPVQAGSSDMDERMSTQLSLTILHIFAIFWVLYLEFILFRPANTNPSPRL